MSTRELAVWPPPHRRRLVALILTTGLVAAGCSNGESDNTATQRESGGAMASSTLPASPSSPSSRRSREPKPESSPSSATPSRPSPTRTAAAPPTASVVVPPKARDNTRQGARTFIETNSRLLKKPGRGPGSAVGAATGSALGALKAARLEFENNGWRQVGSPRVVKQHVVSYRPQAKPPTMTLAVCLDSSGVRVVDAEGNTIPNSAGGARTWNLFTLVKPDANWLVTNQDFPNDPDC